MVKNSFEEDGITTLRLDVLDGRLYSKKSFVETYGGDSEWIQSERRIDPTDNRAYTLVDFAEFYGGDAQWKEASVASESQLLNFVKEESQRLRQQFASKTSTKADEIPTKRVIKPRSNSSVVFTPSTEIFGSWQIAENRVTAFQPQLPPALYAVRQNTPGSSSPASKTRYLGVSSPIRSPKLFSTVKYTHVVAKSPSFDFSRSAARFKTQNVDKNRLSLKHFQMPEADTSKKATKDPRSVQWLRLSRGMSSKKHLHSMTAGLCKLMTAIHQENEILKQTQNYPRNKFTNKTRYVGDFEYDGFGKPKVGTFKSSKKKSSRKQYSIWSVPLHELRSAYEKVDDHDGYISLEEFCSIFEICGVNLSDNHAKLLHKFMDINGDGKVEWAEMDAALTVARRAHKGLLDRDALHNGNKQGQVGMMSSKATRTMPEAWINGDLIAKGIHRSLNEVKLTSNGKITDISRGERISSQPRPKGGQFSTIDRFKVGDINTFIPDSRNSPGPIYSSDSCFDKYNKNCRAVQESSEHGRSIGRFGISGGKRDSYLGVGRPLSRHEELAKNTPGPRKLPDPKYRGPAFSFGSLKEVKSIDKRRPKSGYRINLIPQNNNKPVPISYKGGRLLPEDLLKPPPNVPAALRHQEILNLPENDRETRRNEEIKQRE